MDLKILTPLISELKTIKGVECAYVYGSILNKDFDKNKSDIDFLIIAKEKGKDNLTLLNEIRKLKKKYENEIRTDLNICFYSEFKLRIHVNRPPTYFFGISKRNKLLFGQDLLKEVTEKELNPKMIYERIANLAQSARALYLNKEEKDPGFWIKYQRKWLVVAFLEALYFEGILELNKEKGLKKFIEITKAPKSFTKLLDLEKSDIKLLFESSEWLRNYFYHKFINEL